MYNPDQVPWRRGPYALPAGAQVAMLEGKDVFQPGPFTVRLKFPAGYRIAPHWHPGIQHITVISGTLYLGLGETYDEEKAHPLEAGGFAYLEQEVRHFYFARSETIIQLHGEGPWQVHYMELEDDPRQYPRK